MKQITTSLLVLFVAALLVFSSCRSSTVWGHKDAGTPTKFSTDRRYIRR